MKNSFKEISLTSASATVDITDKNKFYSISGTFAAARTITLVGSPTKSISFVFYVNVDKNSFAFTLLGVTVTTFIVNNKPYFIEAKYVSGAWVLNIFFSAGSDDVINRTAMLLDSIVTNAKLSNMAANTVKVNATSGSAVPTDIAITANSLLGRLAGNIVNVSFLDEDDMASDSASAVASQQSIKAFVLTYTGHYFKRYEDTTTAPNVGVGKEALSTFDLSTLTLTVGDTIRITSLFDIYNGADTNYVSIGIGATVAPSVLYGQLYDSSFDHSIELVMDIKVIGATSFKYKIYSKRYTIPVEEFVVHGTIGIALTNAYAISQSTTGTKTNMINFTVEQFKA